MTANKTTMAFGWRVYGLGVMALGLVCLAWGDFDLGQPVPKDFPDRTALAYAAAAFMVVAGAAVKWRRTAAWGAAALTAYYALIVVILVNGRVVLAHYTEFGTYSGVAEQLAIAAGVAILTGVQARLAAILLNAMFASFTPLVHVPMLLADPSRYMNWTENALNLALIGAAGVVADSLARPRQDILGTGRR
jgi:hypothetical protein